MADIEFEPREGETILWTAVPRHGPWRAALSYFAGALWLLFAAFYGSQAVALVQSGDLRGITLPTLDDLTKLASVFLLPLGALVWAWESFRKPARLRRTSAFITDRRIGWVEDKRVTSLPWCHVWDVKRAGLGWWTGIHIYDAPTSQHLILWFKAGPTFTLSGFPNGAEGFRIARQRFDETRELPKPAHASPVQS